MTKENKWVTVLVAFSICFYLGWFIPLLWLLFLILGIVLLATPTKKKTETVGAMSVTQPSQTDIETIERRIRELIHAEEDESFRRGLEQALDVIQETAGSSSAVASLPQNALKTDEFVPPVQITKEDKQRQELRNVNVILYTASFLLVGAAAAFIGFSEGVADLAKFILLLLVTATFYLSGFVLYGRSVRLRPAATAFVGTGLALIPFVGLALYSYVLQNASLVWWLTSLLGLAAFVLAITRIRTNVMAYLMLAFVFSLATSSVAVLQAPFVWYFVSVILVGSILTYISFKRPKWLPAELVIPLERNAQFATPVALVGSLFAYNSLASFDYTLISGVATLHYLVNALGFSKDSTRLPFWMAARGLGSLFVASFTYSLTSSWEAVCFALTVVAVLTHLYSIRYAQKRPQERAWLWIAQGLLVISLTGWFYDMVSVSGTLLIIILMAIHQLAVMRRVEYSIFGILAGILLPLTVLRGVAEPPVAYEHIAAGVLALSVGFLALRTYLATRDPSFRQAATIGYAVLLAEAILLAAGSLDLTWFASIMTLAGILVYLAAFIEKQVSLHIVSNVILAIGVVLLYGDMFGSFTWAPFAAGLTLAIIWYGLRWYFVSQETVNPSNVDRADVMATSTVVALLIAGLAGMFSNPDTIIASALIGCLGAGIIAYEGQIRGLVVLYEAALYVLTFCLQRLVAHVYPDANVLVYTHWWALTGGLAALLYLRRSGNRAGATTRGILALTALSLPTGLYALSDPDAYQLLFLFEHVALAVSGLALGKKLLVQWGAIGVALAVLWLLQGYTYVLLTLIALGLIGLAIWRLMKHA